MRNTHTLRYKYLSLLCVLLGAFCGNLFIPLSAASKLPDDDHSPAVSEPRPDIGFSKNSAVPSGTIDTTSVLASSNPRCDPSNNACVWEDSNTPGPLECRLPLIFIHGIHGSEDPDRDDTEYFRRLIKELISNYPDLATTYKIYRFHYKSDVDHVQTIGFNLGRVLDSLIADDANFDKQFMIIAHSMGGLVARAYLHNYRHHSGSITSPYKGKLAGERVLKLITLGTPHHGSQLSNGRARTQEVFLGTPWDLVLRRLDEKQWKSLSCLTYGACLERPNRGDLHWDNYDGAWNNRPAYRDDVSEHNALLKSLPSTYDSKIYPYYGYIGNGKIFKREHELYRFGQGFSDLKDNIDRIVDHTKLLVAGVVLERIDKWNFNPFLRVTYLYNDGLVTFQSASFIRSSAHANRRSCPGYDHLDMRDGATALCKRGTTQKPLVQLLVDDLRPGSPELCAPRAAVSTSLKVSGSGPYSVGQKVDGTFSVTNRGNAKLVMKRVVIAGRFGGTCPNNQCPDFSPIPSDITLSPGQTHNYSGYVTPNRTGTYTFSVAYLNPEGKWVIPVASENGTINKLSISVTDIQPRVVVSTSLRLSPGAPYAIGQTLSADFSISNRGNATLAMRQVLVAGRVGDACPDNLCPDSSPISNVTLNPGQTYSYSGKLNLTRSGTYQLYVAYQTPDGKWELPVKSENGNINKLSIVVPALGPTLTGRSPDFLAASPNSQVLDLYGTKLSRALYCYLRSPDGKGVYLYLPLGQVVRVADNQIRIKTKFVSRGTYYITAWTPDGRSNEIAIVVR